MSNQRNLKAFVRYDASGRVVAGSLVLRKKKPKVGRWEEILTYECCNPTTTTTTTAPSTTTTTTTTVIVYSFIGGNGYNSKGESCFAGQTSTYYASVPEGSVTNGTIIYTDSSLTSPQNVYSYLSIAGNAYQCSGTGVLSNGSPC